MLLLYLACLLEFRTYALRADRIAVRPRRVTVSLNTGGVMSYTNTYYLRPGKHYNGLLY